ncbi:DUF192 domain-containing protein [Thermococcus sp.]
MLINETKKKVWHGEVRLADTFLKRAVGLMFKPSIDYALVFLLPAETRMNASIHMFFMFRSIDVLFLDSSRRVVDFKLAKPWRVYAPAEAARYIIEGPVGIIRALHVEVGDEIRWVATRDEKKPIPSPLGIPKDLKFGQANGSIGLSQAKSGGEGLKSASRGIQPTDV